MKALVAASSESPGRQRGFANIEIMLGLVLIILAISLFVNNLQLGVGKALAKTVFAIVVIVAFFAIIGLGFALLAWIGEKIAQSGAKKPEPKDQDPAPAQDDARTGS
jgi:amino acid transporter